MEKTTYAELEFHNVSQDAAERLRKYLKAEPTGQCADGNQGYAETSCFSAKYDYDPESGVLTIEPVHLVPGLRGNRLKRIIQDVMKSPGPQAMDTTADPTPTPAPCAIYNWVVGYLNNNTASTLTYSGQTTDQGNVTSTGNKIDPRAKASDQGVAGIFTNQCTKDSLSGCFGNISWNIDGSTTLTIYYGVNTLTTTSATVAVSGANAKLYKATMDKRTKFSGTCAYLYPTVTLDNA